MCGYHFYTFGFLVAVIEAYTEKRVAVCILYDELRAELIIDYYGRPLAMLAVDHSCFTAVV